MSQFRTSRRTDLMTRRRTRRVDTATLTSFALSTPHRFQTVAVQSLIGFGWKVSSVNHRDRIYVVVMPMISDSSTGTAVYPNGAFARHRNGSKVQWSWDRARDSSYATIADPYVVDILLAAEELEKV